MTIDSKHFEFLLSKVTRLLSPEDFKLPDTPVAHYSAPGKNIVSGDVFMIYVEDKTACGIYVADRWENSSPNTPKRLVLHDKNYQTPLWLSAWQIDWLNKQGRILVDTLQPRKDREIVLPGSALGLTKAQNDHAHWLLDYIDHYEHLCLAENGGRRCGRLLERAKAEVAAKRAEKAPTNSTLFKAMSRLRNGRNMDRVCAVAPHRNVGNSTLRFNARAEEAVQIAVHDAWRDPKGTWLTVKQRLDELCSPGNEFADVAEAVSGMSPSTLQRRLAQVDEYTKSFLRYGEEYASRIASQRVRLARPDHPLDVVDTDHTTLDIVVYDDLAPVSFGRPDVIVFRDRHSGCVIGFGLSFEAPSFAGFVAGLRHAAYPKDPQSLPEGVTWPWYGMPTRLGVDHASHFIGGSMENGARELGFQVIEYRPGRPWEKGALEHLFAILGMQMLDSLPGATTNDPDERLKFDAEAKKAKPVLSIRELYGFLLYYFAEVYNRSLHAGLGPLVTLGETPDTLWKAGIANAPTRPLIDPNVFTRLAGYTVEVTIQTDGIRIEYLHYQSAELVALRLHPKHRDGTRKHRATKYVVTRDPNNLGRIWVRDPYRKVMIEVPVIDIEQRYANGLTLFQHQKIMEHHRQRSKTNPGIEALTEARRGLERTLSEMHAKRKKHNTALKLARFVSGQATKIRQSQIIELSANPEVNSHMNYARPGTQTPEPKVSPKERGVMPNATDKPAATTSTPRMRRRLMRFLSMTPATSQPTTSRRSSLATPIGKTDYDRRLQHEPLQHGKADGRGAASGLWRATGSAPADD